jgi:hypothetical protein
MPAKRTPLTPDVQQAICSLIRNGIYPHVAAEAAGVSHEQFESWLVMGQRKGARTMYRRFAHKVAGAQAQARAKAELAAFKKDPLTWLKSGPGKETPDSPGWSAHARSLAGERDTEPQFLLSPEFQEFLAMLRRVLTPYPEALSALNAALVADRKRAKKRS